jgi:midasin (ATPase involved in ribosome maturation)
VEDLPATTIEHMRWLLQKYRTKQDVLIAGPPGPERRRLAMQFFELLGLEVEVLALTRDTTESDLKQRRELLADGTAVWVDQAPVRAALRGRVLLLDGLERAERNVLPTLNNLLEAREMALEDGRLIISQERALAFTAHVQQPEPGLDIALEPEPGGSSVRVLPSGMVAADPGFWVVSLASPSPPDPG